MKDINSKNNKKVDEDDYTYEDDDSSSKFEEKLKKVKKKLEVCEKEKQEYLDGWQRSKADYINLKKRSEEDKNRIREYAAEDVLCDLLTVIDSFEMAFKDEDAWNNAPENWRIGIEFIYNQLIKALEKHNVEQINPIGDEFDPQIHHSAEMVDVEDEQKDGIVIEVVQKGYNLKDRNIRPATVKVGKFTK